jgi:hypothetical protein
VREIREWVAGEDQVGVCGGVGRKCMRFDTSQEVVIGVKMGGLIKMVLYTNSVAAT